MTSSPFTRLLVAADAPAGTVGARAFRPEIQALRALAVGLVVVFHLFPTRLTGGFIGVDVFFVISGFLITAHLLGELERTGRIDIPWFWARRIRRLLPAAFVVLAVCLVLTVLLVPGPMVDESYLQIGAAALYALNWFLASDSTDYLSADNAPTLVQHFWSLSVEEQFYLVWPALLALVALIAYVITRLRSKESPRVRPALVIGVIVVVGLASAAWCVWETRTNPAPAYFDTFGRAWEFAAGGLAAAVVVRWESLTAGLQGSRIRTAMSWAGLLLIAGGALLMDGTWFPGPLAVVPVLGTLLIIMGGLPRTRWSPSGPYRLRPIQWTGDISYSIYLWHWPLIILFPTLFGPRDGGLAAAGIVVATLVLAALTKRFVEDPARRTRRLATRLWPTFVFAVAGSLLLSGVAWGSGAALNSQREDHASHVNEQIEAGVDCLGAPAMLDLAACPGALVMAPGVDPGFAAGDLDKDWCLTGLLEEWRTCVYGDTDGSAGTLALVGDSHAAALVDAFDKYYADHDRRVETFLRFGCPAFTSAVVEVQSRTPEEREACAVWSARVIDTIVADPSIDVVVFTGFASAYEAANIPIEGRLTADAVEATLRRVADAGKRVVVLHDVPRTAGTFVPTCLGESTSREAPCATDRAVVTAPDALSIAAERLSGVVGVADVDDAICDAERCYSVIGGIVVYADDNHLSRTFVRSLAPYLGRQIDDAIEEQARS